MNFVISIQIDVVESDCFIELVIVVCSKWINVTLEVFASIFKSVVIVSETSTLAAKITVCANVKIELFVFIIIFQIIIVDLKSNIYSSMTSPLECNLTNLFSVINIVEWD